MTARTESKVRSALAQMGLDEGYQLVVSDSPDLVENTAAQELRMFLAAAGLSLEIIPESKSHMDRRVFLGRTSNLAYLRRTDVGKELDLGSLSSSDDGYRIKQLGTDIVVAGANPRGTLYAVYALEDYLNEGARQPLDLRKVPYYQKRASGLGYYHNRYANLLDDERLEEKIAYLSRLGINQWTSLDGFVEFTLNKLVQSDVFPFQTPPDEAFQKNIRSISSLCSKYGIDYYLFLWEPILPKLAGDIDEYPREALGAVNKPYANPEDGFDRTLCINSAIVQDHYRNLMKKLVREFPEVKGVFFYNMDSGAWICTPELCDRCITACQDSPPDEFNPWESQALLVSLLAEAAREVRPTFDFRFWGAHFHGKRFEKLVQAVKCDSFYSNWNASDHDIMIPDCAVLAPEFQLVGELAEKRSIPLFAYFELNNLECVPRSLPFPFHVCDSLKKFKRWGVRNLLEVSGPIADHNSINALVMKELQWNPDQDPEAFLKDLATRQFGEAAGRLMYQAWEELKKAMDVWNDMPNNPLSGSQFALTIGTAEGIPRAILPDIAEKYFSFIDVLIKIEPFKRKLLEELKKPALLDRMVLMATCLKQAAECARLAMEVASDKELIGLCYYEKVNGRPSCKEYAELNYSSIIMAAELCQQRCDMLRAVHLLKDMESARANNDEESAKAKEWQYSELVREDILVQEQFCSILMGFAEKRPDFIRVNMSDKEISDLLASTRLKIGMLKKYLVDGWLPSSGDIPRDDCYRFSWV